MLFEVLRRECVCDTVPTAMCHASTVLPLPDGRVLAAWFGGSHEGRADTAIWYSRREAHGWSPPARLPQTHPEAHWNPVLRGDTRGVIWLYYKVGDRIQTWRTYVTTSADNGTTWSAARELVPGDTGGRGPVRNKVVRLACGRLLAPASLEKGEWTAFADISDDDGLTWQPSAVVRVAPEVLALPENAVAAREIPVSEQSFHGRGVIQPSIWEDTHGVHMLLRSTEGAIFRSDSTDHGAHWSPAVPTSLPNNNSGLDLATLADGTLVLACNPIAANWGARSPLRLLVSEDAGAHWSTLLDCDSGRGEFAYPAIVAAGDTLHLTYTWKRATIAYWRIACGA